MVLSRGEMSDEMKVHCVEIQITYGEKVLCILRSSSHFEQCFRAAVVQCSVISSFVMLFTVSFTVPLLLFPNVSKYCYCCQQTRFTGLCLRSLFIPIILTYRISRITHVLLSPPYKSTRIFLKPQTLGLFCHGLCFGSASYITATSFRLLDDWITRQIYKFYNELLYREV